MSISTLTTDFATSVDCRAAVQFGVSVDRVPVLAAGGVPAGDAEEAAAPALRAGWLSSEWAECDNALVCDVPTGGAPMVSLFDLGVRVRAWVERRPQVRLSRPSFTLGSGSVWVRDPVAVYMSGSGQDTVFHVGVLLSGTEFVTERVLPGGLCPKLATLVRSGSSRGLVVDCPATLAAMRRCAEMSDPTDPVLEPAAVHVEWWSERAEFPASGATVVLSSVLADRYCIPVDHPTYMSWVTWFGLGDVSADSRLCVLWQRAVAGAGDHPVAVDRAVDRCDSDSFTGMFRRMDKGLDWRHGDSVIDAAAGLAARESSASVAAYLTAIDPVGFVRARFVGDTAQGAMFGRDSEGRGHMVRLDGFPCRLRDGERVKIIDPVGAVAVDDGDDEGGVPAKKQKSSCEATVAGFTSVDGMQVLILTTGPVNSRWLDRLVEVSGVVQVVPSAPFALTSFNAAAREVRSRCFAATGQQPSWLVSATGVRPQRRDGVPLDVMVAACR